MRVFIGPEKVDVPVAVQLLPPLLGFHDVAVNNLDEAGRYEGGGHHATLLHQVVVGGYCVLSGENLHVDPLLSHLEYDLRVHGVPACKLTVAPIADY